MMDIRKALQWAVERLRTSDSPNLDAEVLLSFTLKKPKEFLYAHPKHKLTNLKLKTYKLLIKRRAKSEPVAYLTGHKEFYGLDFLVSQAVLIPRPETELLVDEVKNLLTIKPFNHLTVIDIGTGSGCIPISIAKTTLPNCHSDPAEAGEESLKIYATDISPAVLKIARLNAHRHGVARRIKFLRGNLLCPLLKKEGVRGWSIIKQLNHLIIVANLPYLTTKQWRQTPPDIRLYEPRQALDAGPDGLKYFRELFRQLSTFVIPTEVEGSFPLLGKSLPRTCCGEGLGEVDIMLLLEIDPAQTKKIKGLAKKYLPSASLKIKKDLAGRGRVVIIKLYQKSPARAI